MCIICCWCCVLWWLFRLSLLSLSWLVVSESIYQYNFLLFYAPSYLFMYKSIFKFKSIELNILWYVSFRNIAEYRIEYRNIRIWKKESFFFLLRFSFHTTYLYIYTFKLFLMWHHILLSKMRISLLFGPRPLSSNASSFFYFALYILLCMLLYPSCLGILVIIFICFILNSFNINCFPFKCFWKCKNGKVSTHYTYYRYTQEYTCLPSRNHVSFYLSWFYNISP